ncbi:hypothetical protein M9H77_04923 [Catharanthus roseus]|uniref:Uncharacterized protein n=1 Tax=Catharanthus roseus TaxID=4058 RepID=A0ACC0CFL0_CATRO|nr:hypothetical protein M9H77_04923 [Catharanthus roseus]
MRQRKENEKALGDILEDLLISDGLFLVVSKCVSSHTSHEDPLMSSGVKFEHSCYGFEMLDYGSFVDPNIVGFELECALFDHEVLVSYVVNFQGLQAGANIMQAIKDWLISECAFEERSFQGEDSRTILFKGGADDMNRMSQSHMKLKYGSFTSVRPKEIKANDGNMDNGMAVYMENSLKIDCEGPALTVAIGLCWHHSGSVTPTVHSRSYPTVVGTATKSLIEVLQEGGDLGKVLYQIYMQLKIHTNPSRVLGVEDKSSKELLCINFKT